MVRQRPSRPSPAPAGRLLARALTLGASCRRQVFGRSGSSNMLSEYRQVHLNTARIAEHKFCTNKVITYR